jgi:hypothetical protein
VVAAFAPALSGFEGYSSVLLVAAAAENSHVPPGKKTDCTALRALRRAQVEKSWRYLLDRTGVCRYPHMKYGGGNTPQEHRNKKI